MDSVGGVILLLAGAIYLYSNSSGMESSRQVKLIAKDEVDPTRWRHDGSQPFGNKMGNGKRNVNFQVRDLFEHFPRD